MKKTAALCLSCILILTALIVSCTRPHTINSLNLPATPEVSTVERFALVIDPFISLRDQPGDTGITIAHGRRGEIYPVQGKRIILDGNKNIIWLNLKDGWALESSVQLYSSPDKAKTASDLLK